MSEQPPRDHLFISYATQDSALCRWLALRLTAAGYRVWCDQFKLLGGESYPKDIDYAIKERTFRMLALLSHSSMQKPNPTKERTLALNIARERGEFLIPLNVDGLKPTELDWMTSDLTFIPFHSSWAVGLGQLLKKLQVVGAPRPCVNGGQIAAETFLPSNLVVERQEVLTSNFLRFERIPEGIHCFSQTRRLTDDEYSNLPGQWPMYRVDSKTVLSFSAPPDVSWKSAFKQEKEAWAWQHFANIKRISSTSIVSSLLHKSVKVGLLGFGCRETADHKLVFVPSGLLPDDKITLDYNGHKTWLRVRGYCTLRRSGELPQRCYHHLAFSHRIRQDVVEGFIVQIRIHLYLLDEAGKMLPTRAATSKRRMISRNWWNDKWLKRYLALSEIIRQMGTGCGARVVVSPNWLQLEADRGIDESQLGGDALRIPQEAAPAELEDEDGVEYVVPEEEDTGE